MIKLRRSRLNESDSRYFNGYTDDTVPDVPYGNAGHPQYNPMIVNDRIELMNDVIKKLEDYWYSENPKLEDEITRVTKRGDVLYVRDIYWELDNPDVVTVKFGVAGFNGSNDRVAEIREIDINFEDFLGHDIEDNLVIFITGKIKSLLDSVLHGGLYKENKNMIRLRRSRRFESRGRKGFADTLMGYVNRIDERYNEVNWNKFKQTLEKIQEVAENGDFRKATELCRNLSTTEEEVYDVLNSIYYTTEDLLSYFNRNVNVYWDSFGYKE